MRSEIGVEVAASPRRVFDLARPVEDWARRLPHYRNVRVLARRDDRVLAQMVAVRRWGPLPVPVTWRAICWWDDRDPDDLRLEFRHVRGATRGMVVTWHIQPTDAAADHAIVRIVHVFHRPLPLVDPDTLPRLIDRVFTRPIASRTLATFKRLAEAGA